MVQPPLRVIAVQRTGRIHADDGLRSEPEGVYSVQVPRDLLQASPARMPYVLVVHILDVPPR